MIDFLHQIKIAPLNTKNYSKFQVFIGFLAKFQILLQP